MMESPKKSDKESSLHPKNLHRGSYDLEALIKTSPELDRHVFVNSYGNQTLNFSDPKAVIALNQALLKHYYQVEHWEIPNGFLCPPVPGRADYIHYLGDLLAQGNSGTVPNQSRIHGLDIGTGANLIYPLLGVAIQGWRMYGAELNLKALASAKAILSNNPSFQPKIELRAQPEASRIFHGIIQKEEFFDFTLCNPPFHDSPESAQEGSRRKVRNLTGKVNKKAVLNFGGQAAELWTEGGEMTFIENMIKESVDFKNQVFWFTCLVSKSEHLKPLEALLKRSGVNSKLIFEMSQGNKKSRFLAWTFLDEKKQEAWRNLRWK